MATNPNNAIGTNAAFSGRTSPNAFNDVLAVFSGRGVLGGWQCLPSNNMVVTVGGQSGIRDVAIAEDNAGNKTTIDNISQQPVEIEIAPASTTSASTDYIVAYVNNPPDGVATAGDNPGVCGIIDVRGSGSVAPTDAQIRAAITGDGGVGTTAYYAILATISVPAGATTLTATNIFQGDKARTRDYDELNPKVEELMSQNVYSTTERVVGTWIDGKPIYQRTFSGTAGNGNIAIVSGVSIDLDTLIDAKGHISTADNQLWVFPCNNDSGKKASVAVLDINTNKNITLIVGSYMNGQSYTVTLEYTKTTN